MTTTIDGILLGIDLGTTAMKVAAFDARSGHRLAGEDVPLRVATGDDGRREQTPAAILTALRRAIARITGATVGNGPVCGVGLASQGGSGIVADRRTGKARTPMVLWNDARAFSHFQTLAQQHDTSFWRERTRRDEPGMGLARLAYLRENAPELFDDHNRYVGAGEYLYFHLTGQWRQDPCHALQIGCYDARTETLSNELAALAGITPEFLPPLRVGHEIHPLSAAAAKRFGLPAGIPVAGPYMDHEAGFLSAAQVSKRPLQCSLGTAWVGNFQIPTADYGHTPIQLVIPSPASDDWLVIQPLLTGNVTWDWALRQFVGRNPRQALEKQAAILDRDILPPEGLVAVPWLNRPHPLDPALLGGCSIVGAGPATGNEEFLRAIVAGLGYELQRVFEPIVRKGGVDSVVLSGGASQSPHFRALITALFTPLPVYYLEDAAWMGARGCLHAFSPVVATAAAVRTTHERPLNPDALSAGRQIYDDVFTRLYGHVRAGTAYTVGED